MKTGIKTHTCEELVPNPHTWKIGTKFYRCEELVLNRQRCQWQNSEKLELNANAADYGWYFINVRNTHVPVYAVWNLTSCVFFSQSMRYWYEICDALVRFFSRAVRNWYQFFTVWNLRSVQFAFQQSILWNFDFNKRVVLVKSDFSVIF